jgi:hypothetical protein
VPSHNFLLLGSIDTNSSADLFLLLLLFKLSLHSAHTHKERERTDLTVLSEATEIELLLGLHENEEQGDFLVSIGQMRFQRGNFIRLLKHTRPRFFIKVKILSWQYC